jgi:tetratricopeptide (TPR) repeat protein
VFETHGEKGNLASALAELAWSHWLTGDAEHMLQLSERALALATEAADPLALRDAADSVGRALVLGTTPCHVGTQRIDTVRRALSGYGVVDASIRLYLAEILGMMGEFDAASDHVREARELFEDLGQRRWSASSEGTSGLLAWWMGSMEVAERDLGSCYRFSVEHGGEIWGREAANYARVLLALGRIEEADVVAISIASGTPEHEVESQILYRSVRGRILAAGGDPVAGVNVAREGVQLAEGTDFVSLLAPALIDLAECLRLAGEAGDVELVERATALFEGKGDRVGASSARTLSAGSPGRPGS